MSMKDLLNKMSQIESLPAPKARQVLNESSPAPVATTTSKRSLKDVFHELSESIPAGAKPLPVMDPTNKQAGAGFLTSTNPAVAEIIKTLDPKDVQIVQAPGAAGQSPASGQQQQSNQQQSQQKSLQTIKASNQPNQTVQEEEFDEGSKPSVKAKLAASDINVLKNYGVPGNKMNRAMAHVRSGYSHEKAAKMVKDEALGEGAKVDRMVKHIEKSEKKSGKSKDEAQDIAWATANKRGMLDNKNKKKVKEADIPSSDSDMGAGLGAGRGPTLEGKKPDFLDLDKDGNKKEPMKKAAADKKKKAVKENMNNRIQAARLEGKAHGLKGHAHNGKHYEDMEESRAYHEGYKEGLDECYGMGPIVGLKREARMPVSTRAMARNSLNTPIDEMVDEADSSGGYQAVPSKGNYMGDKYDVVDSSGRIVMTGQSKAEAEASASFKNAGRPPVRHEFPDFAKEGNAFTGALARTPKGGKFSVGGRSFTDRSNYDSKLGEGDFAFEAWDRKLNSLIKEGFSVSISKGEQNAPDSVNVNATDAEADKLLSLVKQAGLGIFGGDDGSDYGSPEVGGRSEINSPGGIEVVDDHDGMMGLMKKLSGIEGASADYEEEDCGCDDEEENVSEARCDECGMMESKCGGHEEVLDEVESEDQMEFKVAEGGAQNPPDSGAHNSSNDMQGNAAANQALATADAGQDIEDGMQDQSVQEELEPWMDKDAAEDGKVPAFMRKKEYEKNMADVFPPALRRVKDEEPEEKENDVKESFTDLYKKLAMLSEESTADKDEKAEKAGKKVTKDIEYDDKKDKKEKVDEWANQVGKGPGKGTDASFEQDIDFMTKVISGGLNKPKSTGQTTVPVVASQLDRLASHDTTDLNESIFNPFRKKTQAELYPENPYASANQNSSGKESYNFSKKMPKIEAHPLFKKLVAMCEEDSGYSQKQCFDVAKQIADDLNYGALQVLNYGYQGEWDWRFGVGNSFKGPDLDESALDENLNEFLGFGKQKMSKEFPNNPYSVYADDGKSPRGKVNKLENHPLFDRLVWMSDDENRDRFSQKQRVALANEIGQELGLSTFFVSNYANQGPYDWRFGVGNSFKGPDLDESVSEMKRLAGLNEDDDIG